jgi:hypothetical protein
MQEQLLPTDFNMPFRAECLEQVSYSSIKAADGRWLHTGFLAYRSGKTTGRQTFTGNTPDEVMVKIREFLITLK